MGKQEIEIEAEDTEEVCLHCGRRKRRLGQRGLCSRCYENRDIRCKYPMRSNVCRGVGLIVAKDLKGWMPTNALPGTNEKLMVLEYRASKGWPLWHPDDARKE